jgi:hypothetical protein
MLLILQSFYFIPQHMFTTKEEGYLSGRAAVGLRGGVQVLKVLCKLGTWMAVDGVDRLTAGSSR